MPVDFRGKQYFTVSERVAAFRADHSAKDGWGITTDIFAIDDAVIVVTARITDPEGRVIATGSAEEARTDRGVNSTSALENAETSAIGRALAAAGFGGDGEYASADELAGALKAQGEKKPTPRKAAPKKAAKREKPVAKHGKLRTDLDVLLDLIGQLPDGDTRTTWFDWTKSKHSAANVMRAIEKVKDQLAEVAE